MAFIANQCSFIILWHLQLLYVKIECFMPQLSFLDFTTVLRFADLSLAPQTVHERFHLNPSNGHELGDISRGLLDVFLKLIHRCIISVLHKT